MLLNPFAGSHSIHRRGRGPDGGSRPKAAPARQARQATLTTFLQQAASRGAEDGTEGSQQPCYPDIDLVEQGGSSLATSSPQEAERSPTAAHASPAAPQASPQGSNAAKAMAGNSGQNEATSVPAWGAL